MEWIKWLNNPNIIPHFNIKIPSGKWYFVDGFDPITNTIYEFNGDFWHGNPEIHKPNDINNKNKRTFGELYQATINRKQELISLGYKYVDIWESDWEKIKKA